VEEEQPRPNELLRLQRQLRGWSRDEVADRLHRLAVRGGEQEHGVDASMVGRWERGTRWPAPQSVRLLSTLFEVPAEKLGIVRGEEPEPPIQPSTAEEGERSTGRFVERVTALLGFERAGGEPWERLLRTLTHGTSVDAETVAHAERTTVALENFEPTSVGSRALVGLVTGHLDQISLLLRGSVAPDLRSQLCSVAGETAGMAGWLYSNLGDSARATAYFQSAVRAAREAGDRALGIALVGSAACQSRGPDGLQSRILRLQGSRDFALADATPSNRSWMAAKEADAYAQLGRDEECLRALSRAATQLAKVEAEGDERRPRFMKLDFNWLAGEYGASLAKLGRTEEARGLLGSVLDRLGPAGERDRAWLTLALATTYQKDREPEEAARTAHIAFERASRINLEAVLALVQEMVEDLKTMGDFPAVRELDQEIRGT
jgi:transcriptional regulator with XRE-family HTH domain/tetratricopeptide (TPR) repeat protein